MEPSSIEPDHDLSKLTDQCRHTGDQSLDLDPWSSIKIPLKGAGEDQHQHQQYQPDEKDRVPAHRSHDQRVNQKRSKPFQFGSRYLLDDDDVYNFNAWDHVKIDAEYQEHADAQLVAQREAPVSAFDQNRFNNDPAKWWNLFYKNNADRFFKDRKWLLQEFPILSALTRKDGPPALILEVGAGAGNTVFPLYELNENPSLRLYACDFSRRAVDLIRQDPRCDGVRFRADVWDMTSRVSSSSSSSCSSSSTISPSTSEGESGIHEEFKHINEAKNAKGLPDDRTKDHIILPPGLEPESVDVVMLIFVFSSLSPSQWRDAVRNIYSLLRPGGHVLFRDYARGDLAQVRFRGGRYLQENFYVRGDGTRVYFFDKDELRRIWAGGESTTPAGGGRGGDKDVDDGLDTSMNALDVGSLLGEDDKGEDPSSVPPDPAEPGPGPGPGSTSVPPSAPDQGDPPQPATAYHQPPTIDANTNFKVTKLDIDHRLLVNRKRKLKMYRCWIQALFTKRSRRQFQDENHHDDDDDDDDDGGGGGDGNGDDEIEESSRGNRARERARHAANVYGEVALPQGGTHRLGGTEGAAGRSVKPTMPWKKA